VILPDVNLLLYAHNEAAPLHRQARVWWEGVLNASTPVGLPWAVVYGFIRLATHPAVLVEPLPPAAALDRVQAWLARDHIELLDPGPEHLRIARRLFEATGLGGSLTPTRSSLPSRSSTSASSVRTTRISAGSPGCAGATRSRARPDPATY